MTHLVRRFFGHISATPLGPSEQEYVVASLTPTLRALFFRQHPGDQRHAYDVAIASHQAKEPVEAALLHDIGKTEADLGPMSRSFATLWAYTSLPVWGRWRSYLDHGAIGATMLEGTDASGFAVAFTRIHPGPAPAGFNADWWESVQQADHQ